MNKVRIRSLNALNALVRSNGLSIDTCQKLVEAHRSS